MPIIGNFITYAEIQISMSLHSAPEIEVFLPESATYYRLQKIMGTKRNQERYCFFKKCVRPKYLLIKIRTGGKIRMTRF